MSYDNNRGGGNRSYRRNGNGGGGRQYRGNGGGNYRGNGGSNDRNQRRNDEFGDSAIMFENASDNPKAPLYRVFITIEGRRYEAGLWVKNGQKGEFWAGEVKPVQDARREDHERSRDRDERRDDRDRNRSDRPRQDYRIRDDDGDDGRGRFDGDPGPRSEADYGSYDGARA